MFKSNIWGSQHETVCKWWKEYSSDLLWWTCQPNETFLMLLPVFLGRDNLPFNTQMDLWGICVQFSAYLHLFVHIYNVPVPKEIQIHVRETIKKTTTNLFWKRQSTGDVVKKLLICYIAKGCAARTQRPWVKRHLLNQGVHLHKYSVFLFRRQSNKQAGVEAFRDAMLERCSVSAQNQEIPVSLSD